jgi:hypothetical protein
VRFTLVRPSTVCSWRCCMRVQFSVPCSAISARIGLIMWAFASRHRRTRSETVMNRLRTLERFPGGPQPSGGRCPGTEVLWYQHDEDACRSARRTASSQRQEYPRLRHRNTRPPCASKCVGRGWQPKQTLCQPIVCFADHWPQDYSKWNNSTKNNHHIKTSISLNRE